MRGLMVVAGVAVLVAVGAIAYEFATETKIYDVPQEPAAALKAELLPAAERSVALLSDPKYSVCDLALLGADRELTAETTLRAGTTTHVYALATCNDLGGHDEDQTFTVDGNIESPARFTLDGKRVVKVETPEDGEGYAASRNAILPGGAQRAEAALDGSQIDWCAMLDRARVREGWPDARVTGERIDTEPYADCT